METLILTAAALVIALCLYFDRKADRAHLMKRVKEAQKANRAAKGNKVWSGALDRNGNPL